jgi:hypothetical protein
MPERALSRELWGLIPWFVGFVAGLVGVALRNEWTTRQMQRVIFDQNGDVRLVLRPDCQRCRSACQEAFARALADHRSETNQDRANHKDEIQRLHDKIDGLPQKILNLLNGYRTK